MITGDIGARLQEILRAAVGAGELPASVMAVTPSGTWRPAPAGADGGPGTYATSLPFTLAKLASREARTPAGPARTPAGSARTPAGPAPGTPGGQEAARLAGLLAAGLAGLPWISSARVTGGGYLTVTVTAGHLAALPARITDAGPAAARSDALKGRAATAPCTAEPCTAEPCTAEPCTAEPCTAAPCRAELCRAGSAATWETAWRSHRDVVVGRLADAAGAKINFFCPERNGTPPSPAQGERGPVQAAVAWYGADAVRYALARTASPQVRAIERQLSVPLHLANPFVAVTYAHADAASTLRWAAALGLRGSGGAIGAAHDEDSLPAELVLLDLLSWLAERVASAARRQRPAELTSYLEAVAVAWRDCQEQCPALPFRGAAAASDPVVTAARLALAEATSAVLAVGLRLLGIDPRPRL